LGLAASEATEAAEEDVSCACKVIFLVYLITKINQSHFKNKLNYKYKYVKKGSAEAANQKLIH